MRFAPVHLAPEHALEQRVSQTFLRHFNVCPRSAYLYQSHRDDSKTMQMLRGTALHEIAAACTLAAVGQDEPTIPPELAKAITDEVLRVHHVPIEEHDYVRESAYRWASDTTFDPQSVVACETMFVLEIAGFQVRARVDFAQLLEEGAAVLIRDYKSGRGAPTWEDISRRRADGTLAAKAFQLILYAVLLAFGVPVRVEVDDDGEVTETPEPFSVAGQAQRFDLEFVYPGIEDREGRMLRRAMSLTRLELIDYRASIEALILRVHASVATGDWPAIVSDAACGECPAAELCPIPRELRDFRGSVNTDAQAAQAAEVLDREKAEHRARQTELRNFAKAHGGEIRFGRKVFELVYSESEQIIDKDGLLEAVDRAVRYGEPFDRDAFIRLRGRTDFRARDLADDEVEVVGNGG